MLTAATASGCRGWRADIADIADNHDAAGDRFDEIELNALIQAVVVIGDREAAAAEFAAVERRGPSG